MNKYKLQSKVKSKGTAYLYWFCLGGHYAYLNKWLIQLLYWCTLGGFGLWALIDLFTMGSKVNKYNSKIYQQMEDIDKREHSKNLELLATAVGK